MVEHMDYDKPVKEFDKKGRKNKSMKKWLSSNFLPAKTSSKKVTDMRDDFSHGGISESGHNNNNNKINTSTHNNRQVIPEEVATSRSMPREIHYDFSGSESELSVISGTTDLDSKAGPPAVAFRDHVPITQFNSNNLFEIDANDDLDDDNDARDDGFNSPEVQKKIVLVPDPSGNDSAVDSLFLNSTSSQNLINGDPTKSALQSDKKRKPPKTAVQKLLQKMADYAFKKVDRENTGVLDQSEFYYGLLIVHSKFSEYFGPVVCRSVQRPRAERVFRKMMQGSTDCHICQDKFADAVVLIFTDIMVESAKHVLLTISVVSIIAPFIFAITKFIFQMIIGFFFFFMPFVPSQSIIGTLLRFIIPQSIYNTAPLTFMSCLLTYIFVPFLLRQRDANKNKISIESLQKQVLKKVEAVYEKFSPPPKRRKEKFR